MVCRWGCGLLVLLLGDDDGDGGVVGIGGSGMDGFDSGGDSGMDGIDGSGVVDSGGLKKLIASAIV